MASDLTALPSVASAAIAPPAAWRTAGALALAHVVLLFSGFAFEPVADPDASPAELVELYAHADPTRALIGGYVEAMSFVVLAVTAAILARLLAQRSTVGRYAATAFLLLAGLYVASTLAVGFPPGGAALLGAHLGVSPEVVATVNDIRNLGFVLQVAVQAAMTLALGVAAVAERAFPRWGWVGVGLGSLFVVLTPLMHNVADLLMLVWWVVLGVLCLRTPRADRAEP